MGASRQINLVRQLDASGDPLDIMRTISRETVHPPVREYVVAHRRVHRVTWPSTPWGPWNCRCVMNLAEGG